MTGAGLLDALRDAAGADAVRSDDAALAASDLHVQGARPAAVVRPASAEAAAAAVAAATSRGYALSPAPASLLKGIKALLDPAGLMNPGVLGLTKERMS